MSIWNDCEDYDAFPFYGFPVKPSFKDGFVIFEFPLGYEPNGSQTQEVVNNLIKMFGDDKKCKENVVTDKLVKIKIDNDKLAYEIYRHYMKMH